MTVGRLGLAALFVASIAAAVPADALARQQRDGDALPDTLDFLFQLENGLPGVLVTDPTMDRLRFSVFVRAGWGDDRTQGVVEMVAQMVERGPCWMGPGRFEEALREIDAEISVQLSPDMAEVAFSASLEDPYQALRLFSGAVRAPCLDRAALDDFQASDTFGASFSEVDDSTLAAAGDLNNPFALVGFVQDFLFRDHENTTLVPALEAAAITLDELNEFYREYFQPTNSVLSVSGPDSAMQLLEHVAQMFSDWEPRNVPVLKRALNFPATAGKTFFVETPNPDGTGFWLSMGLGLPRVDVERRAEVDMLAGVLARLLGANVDRVAEVEVRPFVHVRGPGVLVVRAWVGGGRDVRDVKSEILSAVNTLRESIVEDATLDSVRESLAGSEYAS
ncbi:MAG: insulinase family protein, partial [Gemmatimonadota bacterium]|nr:insulinase family protein [Gemmatimonadota bacterium]